MSSSNQDKAGGVLYVHHDGRYGAVPESLLEDRRLSLKARAVAAWLAIKPQGWDIRISYLHRKLGTLTQENLGKSAWQTIAKELESAGYFTRTKGHGEGGKWDWTITFRAVPTVVSFSADGTPAGGGSSGGKASYKVIPKKKNTNKSTTTAREPTTSSKRSPKRALNERETAIDRPRTSASEENFIFEPEIEKYRSQLEKSVADLIDLDRATVQDLLDELAGTIEVTATGAGVGIESPIAWFRGVAKRSVVGTFTKHYCLAIQSRRNRKSRIEPRASIATDDKPRDKLLALEHLRMSKIVLTGRNVEPRMREVDE